MATTELSSSTTSTIAVSQPPPVAQQSVRADDLLASDSEMQSLSKDAPALEVCTTSVQPVVNPLPLQQGTSNLSAAPQPSSSG
ncbi:hypothetical protein Aduo_011539 [Ancylostoma duodenale]